MVKIPYTDAKIRKKQQTIHLTIDKQYQIMYNKYAICGVIPLCNVWPLFTIYRPWKGYYPFCGHSRLLHTVLLFYIK